MTTEEPLSSPISGMSYLAGSVMIVTVFGIISQLISFVTQIIIASIFGAKADMDAFFAANTLPQYVISIFVVSMGSVFIPILAGYAATGHDDEGRRFVSGLINLSVIVLGGLAIVCIIFAEPLLRLTTPGLSPGSLKLAARIAQITWPTVVALNLSGVLTGIYQMRHRFGWPAAVPILGAVFNLLLVLILTRPFGIIGLAVAGLSSILLQAILLVPIIFSRDWHYYPVLDLRSPSLHQMLRLLLPLLIVSCFTKCTPLVERYLASEFPEGSISHLNYAFRLFSVLSLLISTGIGTVIFPKMAASVAIGDIPTLRRNMSVSLRIMWVLIAPVIIAGIVLAFPLVTALFFRGEFNFNDAVSVAGLLRIYLIAMIGACLGVITGRAFYALKDTRTLGIYGTIEAIIYILYTVPLARNFGIIGIACGFVIYFNISVLWHVLVLRHKLGQKGGRTIVSSFARTGLAAMSAGLAAWILILLVNNVWLQLFLGGIACFAVYVIALKILRSNEIDLIQDVIVGYVRKLKVSI